LIFKGFDLSVKPKGVMTWGALGVALTNEWFYDLAKMDFGVALTYFSERHPHIFKFFSKMLQESY